MPSSVRLTVPAEPVAERPAVTAEAKDADASAAMHDRFLRARHEGDQAAVAGLGLALARQAADRGVRADAMGYLRETVIAATKAGRAEEHAAARLHLAAFAVTDGDMTTACEHWQMAKVLFHDMGRRVELDKVAERMRQARCPTDWILTQF
jgi:hypothetical protein